jgi:VCBS repeat-containing protein
VTVPAPFARITHDEPGRLVVTGELDELGVPALRSALETHGALPDLTVDLTGTTYVCSQAVSVLVAQLRASDAMDRTFTIAADTGSIAQRVLQVLGIPHDAT